MTVLDVNRTIVGGGEGRLRAGNVSKASKLLTRVEGGRPAYYRQKKMAYSVVSTQLCCIGNGNTIEHTLVCQIIH